MLPVFYKFFQFGHAKFIAYSCTFMHNQGIKDKGEHDMAKTSSIISMRMFSMMPVRA